MRTLTPIETAWKLRLQEVPVRDIAEGLGVDRATVYRWLAGIRRAGCCRNYLKKYEAAKKRRRISRLHPNCERLLVEKRKIHAWCGQKLRWWLKKTHNISVSVAQIYRILAKYFVLRSKWKKWVRRPKVPVPTKPRELVEGDKIDLGFLWVHSFVDCFTREVVSVVVDSEDSRASLAAGKLARQYFGPVVWLQTDNGSEYKLHFDRKLKGWWEKRRRITPGVKEENGFVESFNRTLRKECVGWGHYRKDQLQEVQDRVNAFLDHYHEERPHLGLNLMTPNEFTQSHLT